MIKQCCYILIIQILCACSYGEYTCSRTLLSIKAKVCAYHKNKSSPSFHDAKAAIDGYIEQLEKDSEKLSAQDVYDIHSLIDYFLQQRDEVAHLDKGGRFSGSIYRLLMLAPDRKYNSWLLERIGSKGGDYKALYVLEKSADDESAIQILMLAIKYIQGEFKPRFVDVGNAPYWEHLFYLRVNHNIDMIKVILANQQRLKNELGIRDYHIEDIVEPWYLLDSILELYVGEDAGDKCKTALLAFIHDKCNLRDEVAIVSSKGDPFLSGVYFYMLKKHELLIMKDLKPAKEH